MFSVHDTQCTVNVWNLKCLETKQFLNNYGILFGFPTLNVFCNLTFKKPNLNSVRVLGVIVVEEVRAGQGVDDHVAAFDVDETLIIFIESRRQTIQGSSSTMLLDVFHVVEKVQLWNEFVLQINKIQWSAEIWTSSDFGPFTLVRIPDILKHWIPN